MDEKLKRMLIGLVLYCVPVFLLCYTIFTDGFKNGVNWPVCGLGTGFFLAGMYIFWSAYFEADKKDAVPPVVA